MNLENFAEYLKYPSRLYQLPYEELKSLTLQYPYCTNFHLLLLIKSKLEGHPDLDRNLARASTYSIDRKFLRQFMQEDNLLRVESQFTIGEDEVLELKDLFSLETEMEKIPVEGKNDNGREAPAFSMAFEDDQTDDGEGGEEEEEILSGVPSDAGYNSANEPHFSAPAESYSEKEPPAEEPSIIPEDVIDHTEAGIPDAAAAAGLFLVPPELILHISTAVGLAPAVELPPPPLPEPLQEKTAKYHLPHDLVDQVAAVCAIVESWWDQQEQTQVLEWDVPVVQPPARPARIAPTPKSKFKSYQNRYSRGFAKTTPKVTPPAVTIPPTPVKVKKVAELSVREDLGVASETLAGLLVQQHQYDRAIKMYEHLSLLIPEKNTYFAAKIDAIKNL